jgi:hypothetical protein
MLRRLQHGNKGMSGGEHSEHSRTEKDPAPFGTRQELGDTGVQELHNDPDKKGQSHDTPFLAELPGQMPPNNTQQGLRVA